MYPHNNMRHGAQRLVASFLLVLLASFGAGPSALTLLRMRQSSMDCCPTSAHSCCRRTSKQTDQAGAVWVAVNCASRCGSATLAPFHTKLFVDRQQVSLSDVAEPSASLAAEQASSAGSSYL